MAGAKGTPPSMGAVVGAYRQASDGRFARRLAETAFEPVRRVA